MSSERQISIEAGAVTLDGRLRRPDGATKGCVVCHPHPLYGGDMDNNVVVAACDALGDAGAATLRFDFRGVRASSGTHGGGTAEVEDARAAVAFLAKEANLGSVVLVGYSFGAVVALRCGVSEPKVGAIVAIAPPLTMFDASFAASSGKPLLFIAGTRDAYCPEKDLRALVAGFGEGAQVRIVDGADHFFGGQGDAIAQAVTAFVFPKESAS